jgi:hypothetical protein
MDGSEAFKIKNGTSYELWLYDCENLDCTLLGYDVM